MTALATAQQVRTIHILKSRVGLDEDGYRAALAAAGVASSKELSTQQAGAFIALLEGGALSPSKPKRAPTGAMQLDGPFAGKLRALWIVGFDCGVVRDRTDRALVAFVERQTGLSHTRFLRDPSDGRRVIEALKKWLAREAGIDWTVDAREQAAHAQRVAVIEAQWRILGRLLTHSLTDEPWLFCALETGREQELRAVTAAPEHFTSFELDLARAALGRRIRSARKDACA